MLEGKGHSGVPYTKNDGKGQGMYTVEGFGLFTLYLGKLGWT